MSKVSIALGAAVMLACGVARAGTPLGGDDAGFVPPDKGTLKCETTVAKNAAKLTLAVSICHMKAADAGVKGKIYDEEACETKARGKYDTANAKLTTCPPCLDSAVLGDGVLSQLDGLANAALYCDNTSGTPLGGDDSGFVPANKSTLKCQNLTAKQLALMVGTITKCHNKLVAAAAKGQTFDEETCENAAVAKFNSFTGSLANCPACLTALLATFGPGAASGMDTQAGDIYCASPSGAFVD
jgi:hypothetical protein